MTQTRKVSIQTGQDPKKSVHADETRPSAIVNGFSVSHIQRIRFNHMLVQSQSSWPCIQNLHLVMDGDRDRDPHWNTGLSSQGPNEDQKEGEHEQGSQDCKRAAMNMVKKATVELNAESFGNVSRIDISGSKDPSSGEGRLCSRRPTLEHRIEPPEVQLLHMFRQIRDEVGVGMGYLVALVLGLNGGEVDQPASLPPSPPPGQGPALLCCLGKGPTLLSAAASEERGQSSYAHDQEILELETGIIYTNADKQENGNIGSPMVQEGEHPNRLDPQNPVYAEETSPSVIVNGFSERPRASHIQRIQPHSENLVGSRARSVPVQLALVQESEYPNRLDPKNPVYAEETSPSVIVNGFSERLQASHIQRIRPHSENLLSRFEVQNTCVTTSDLAHQAAAMASSRGADAEAVHEKATSPPLQKDLASD
ncbi:hypothetical protein U0070_008427 [Myodes glareolus]|uniref:Uncharacterized protein n=1 Tax=Myodes glareolus TaxID=447135 RepID=A0AAW0HVG2_MYOGA